MTADQLSCLQQRCAYLGLRVAAKKQLGWDYAKQSEMLNKTGESCDNKRSATGAINTAALLSTPLLKGADGMADSHFSAKAQSVPVGTRIGRLTVTSECVYLRGKRRVDCRCDCGKTVNRDIYSLLSRPNASCGCGRFRHSDSGGNGRKPAPEYIVWQQMKDRCVNPSVRAFKYYGGRGITVCQRWMDSYELFLEDVGRKPSPQHSIDRIDVNGNYEPSNVRWATPIEQGRNKRSNRIVTHGGVSRPISEWSEMSGLPHSTISGRLDRGWSPEVAVSYPLQTQFSRKRNRL